MGKLCRRQVTRWVGEPPRSLWVPEESSEEFPRLSSSRRISVFGLGYVGAVSLACLARDGHEMMGVDIDPWKARAAAQWPGADRRDGHSGTDASRHARRGRDE